MLDTRLKETVKAMSQHARGCKKLLEDCRVCRNNVKTYREIAPHELAVLLAEPVFERRFGAIEQLREKLTDAHFWATARAAFRSEQDGKRDHQADRLLQERAHFGTLVAESKQAA